MDFLRLYFEEDSSTGACGAVVVSARPPFNHEISTHVRFLVDTISVLFCISFEFLF